MKTFSIIIPVYNGQDVIGPALDSIYSQGMTNEQFEVICVDDCSPTMDTYNFLSNYTYNGIHPINLKLFRHEVNKRQGGARNTALGYAEGEWVLYLDQDDCFVENSLKELNCALTKHKACDIVMFDYCLHNTTLEKLNIQSQIYTRKGIISETISGSLFLRKYPIPWTPWCYAYKKDFLRNNQILFEENVRFEDVDYVIKATLNAKLITFVPIDVYKHVDSGNNTSFVGKNKSLIEDLFKISIRIKNVACDYMRIDKKAAEAAMAHHIFHYNWLLKSFLWRLSYKDIIKLLHNYAPYKNSMDKFINITIKYPRIYATLSYIARPILLSAVWVKNKLRR